jgi:uncharacterized phage-associated protein
MADARVVSNHLVNIAAANGNTLTPMQVLKLVYIAHGYSLGARGTPLIPNRVEAWKFGPVIPTLYHSIKHWRDKPVGVVVVTGLEDFRDGDEEFVRTVYDAYSGYDGVSLSNLTHRNGTPWHEVYEAGRSGIPIPDDLIQHHYRALLAA